MPMYEFQCSICNAVHEKLAKHDQRVLPCDSDGCFGLCTKISSAPGIVFQKKFYPNGKDWNETRREAWEKPKSWEREE